MSNETNPEIPGILNVKSTDATWIMTSSFIVFTMQTGFGLLESGCVSVKNEVQIMMKNIADIVLGGFSYWIFGFALSFGRGYSNYFVTVGDFCVDASQDDPLMGPLFAAFLFQLSFSTTATTIVSGAMAERCDFNAYCLFSFLNTIVYSIPAGWVWGEHGFLKYLGVVDIAGSGAVHLLGGSSAFASAMMLGPRLGRYMNGSASLPLSNPVNCCMGLFVLWWGWLAFNSGSTFGLSDHKWQYAAKAATMTMVGSFGGGIFSVLYSFIVHRGDFDIMIVINGILGSLVSVTAGCFLFKGWQSLLIGAIGAFLVILSMPFLNYIGVDDPVGATSVHGLCGFWGVVAVGLFASDPYPLDTTNGRTGLFEGGGWYLLGVQTLASVCILTWSFVSTVVLLWLINLVVAIRMSESEELLGGDLGLHLIRHNNKNLDDAIESVLQRNPSLERFRRARTMGDNPGHEAYVRRFYGVDFSFQHDDFEDISIIDFNH